MEVEPFQPQTEPMLTKEEEELRDFRIYMENNKPTSSQEEYFNSRPPLAFAEVFGGGYIVEFEDEEEEEEVSSQLKENEQEPEAAPADVELVVEAEKIVEALSLSPPQTQTEAVGSCCSSSSNQNSGLNGEEEEEEEMEEDVHGMFAFLEQREKKIMKSWPYWYREG